MSHHRRHAAGSLLQVNLLTMPFNRDVKLDAGKVEAMASQLQFAAQTRSFVCVSRESLLSRKLKPQVHALHGQQHVHVHLDSQRQLGLQEISGTPTV